MIFSDKISIKLRVALPRMASICFFTVALFCSQTASASVPNVADMLSNFTDGLPDLMRLVTATAYVLGMWFIYEGISQCKQFGEQRTQYSSNASLKGPLIRLTVGTLLLYLPSSMVAGLTTLWDDPTPYAYLDEINTQWTLLVTCGVMLIQFIGTVSFIRGLVTLNRLAGSSAAVDTFSRGLTHIIAGVLCVNLYDFMHAVFVTLGIRGVIA